MGSTANEKVLCGYRPRVRDSLLICSLDPVSAEADDEEEALQQSWEQTGKAEQNKAQHKPVI